MRWFGHVVRMSEVRVPKQILEVRAGGRRPRVKWINYLNPAFQKGGLHPRFARATAKVKNFVLPLHRNVEGTKKK